ncbi:MAG: enoyl-CoA hydratase-related protein [Actinomycetota bacterium]
MTHQPGFQVEIADGIAVVTLDRPKANAIDAATSVALGETFAGFDRDPAVRVAIFTGAGERFFSAGWDLTADEAFDSDYGVGGFGGFTNLPDRRTPVIAAVNGMAVGGGFEIAMAADLLVAADHAQFFLPEAGLGILPDNGAVRLPQRLPAAIANEMLLTGRRMDAEEAARWGLVNRVVSGAELMTAAHQLALDVCWAAPLSVAAILDIGRRTAHTDPIKAMNDIRDLPSYRAAIDSDDAREGTQAHAERRDPVWKGR